MISLIIIIICLAIGLSLTYPHIFNRRDDIPTIPIYISILSSLRQEGRINFYQKYLQHPLRQSGIVRTWLAGKWSLIITDPELLAEVFKNERSISKAGFRKKVPNGMFATLFGQNVIDAHGDDWKRMIHYMKPGFQDRQADYEHLQDLSQRLVRAFYCEQARAPGNGIVYDDIVRRWAMVVTGEHFLQCDFQTLENPHAPLIQMMDDINRTAPTPLLNLFPFLEWFDWLRPSRKDKWAVTESFHSYLLGLAAEHQLEVGDYPTQYWKHASVLEGLKRAQQEGQLSDEEFLGNIVITFFAGHENVCSLLKSAIWEIGRRPELHSALRKEAFDHVESTKVRENVDALPLLAAVVLETGRLYPPISQLANRITLDDMVLGERYHLPKGQWVGWNAYAVQTDPRIWGDDSLEFKPERWGTTNASEIEKMHQQCQNKCTYVVFNAHARKCLGRSFALLQTKTLLLELLKAMTWSVDPTYVFRALPGSIFSPHNARMIFNELGKRG